jgi:hypothetical protein
MPITISERFFGEGISGYGEEQAAIAFKAHQKDIRIKRVIDCLGKDAKLSCQEIVSRFEEVAEAMNRADVQVENDNFVFVKEHKIDFKVKDWS